MRVYADYHTHTTFSDGRGRLEDNVSAATNIHLEEIGIADHGPRNIGTGVQGEGTYRQIKEEVERLSVTFPQIKVKVGAEADITGVDGSIDISQEIIDELDFLIIGLHPFVMPTGINSAVFLMENLLAPLSRSLAAKALNDNTKALIEAMKRHSPDIISHPNLKMRVDIDEIAQACAKYNAAYEINVGHHFQTVEEIRQAATWGPQFVISSDAHYPDTIGQLDVGLALAEAAGLTAEQIINVY